METLAGIGFDLDHTLEIDNKLERVAFLRLLELVEEHGGSVMGTLNDESDRIDSLLREQREGAFSIEEAVRQFVATHGLEGRDFYVERFVKMALEMVDEFVIPLPGVKRTLAALRERGIPVAVLSNGWNPLQIRKAQRAGFEGPVLASADIGQQKPSARAFEALAGALGTHAERTWFVGDDPNSDVNGSRNAGFHAVWFDWEHKEFPPDLAPAPYTIHALEELLALLPAVVRAS
ncbi:MAG: HAD family hydrolase [Candidatus Eremiobacteraeota bacterium]|nr:HAD family hydrolase [Candidatus Eremiobacteraeota bacterium]